MRSSTSWSYRIAWIYLLLLASIAIIGPLFTSNAPWKWTHNDTNVYPAWSMYLDQWGLQEAPPAWKLKDWNTVPGQKVENLIPYDPNYMDLSAVGAKKPGLDSKHLLGTDLYGRDVLAGLIQGCHVSLLIGSLSVVLMLILAFLFSIFTSYVGNESLKLSIPQIILLTLVAMMLIYYLFIAFPSSSLIVGIFKVLILISMLAALSIWLQRNKVLSWGNQYFIPLDLVGLRFYELFKSIPALIILLILIGIQPEKSIFNLALTLGLLLWPILYRYIRIEFHQEKAKDSFQSYKNMGFGHLRIIFIQMLPNIMATLITPIIFIFISVIVTEATLSFLGIGLNENIISWGKILAQARQRIDAWWLILFPGLLLFLCLYALNIIARYWSQQSIQKA